MSATAEVRASRLVSSRRACFVARTVLALALALDVRALTRGPVPAQEFAALVRVVKDAQRRFSAQPDANPRCDFKGWLKKNRKRPESAWGDPSRHKSETLREFVRELGEEATTRVRRLVEHDKWRKKRDEWDAWGEEEEIDSTSDGGWEMVRRTRRHESFAESYYQLPSHEPTWRRTKYRPTRWCVEKGMKPRFLGVDCEMCETATDTRALVGVSVVDETGEVLLKTLVKPPGKILDLRRDITGLKEKDVLAAKKTLRDVQDEIASLCVPGTVLVGHSLMYDLNSLKIDHQPVVDTALLFRFKDRPWSTPSLAYLCETLLGRKMRQGAGGFHDSAEDAKAALDLVLWEMNQETPTFEVESPPQTVDANDLRKLLIHRVPQGATADALKETFHEEDRTHIKSARERPSKQTTDAVKATASWLVEFVDAARADAAFARLNAPIVPDAIGRDQKFQSLPSMTRASGDAVTVTVRRMSTPDASVVTTKRSASARAPPEPPAKKKRQRKPKAIPLPGDK